MFPSVAGRAPVVTAKREYTPAGQPTGPISCRGIRGDVRLALEWSGACR